MTGKGGHAAMPHLTADPVLAGSAMITALQQIIAREVNPVEQAVVSVTQVSAGTAFNVIPDTFSFNGTIRAVSDTLYYSIESRLKRVLEGIAAAHNVEVEIDNHSRRKMYVAVVNDSDMADFVADTAQSVLGGDSVVEAEMSMAGEDFGFLAQ